MSAAVNSGGSVTERPENQIIFVSRAGEVLGKVRALTEHKQIFAVTDSNVARLHPELLPKDAYVIEAGEDSKTLSVAQDICRTMLAAGMTRGCTVVAVGGGVVGDLAGFASAIYMRGVDFVNVPTTLLSQVDSAIGGKTGVNLDGYKNMIGAFKMPKYIVICPEALYSLPEREWRCGMGELIKTAILDPELYAYVGANAAAIARREPTAYERAVELASKFKKQVTDEDPTERGRRVILNLGHTVGHALEKCDCHRLSHGEYVMLGLAIEFHMTRGNGESEGFACEAIGLLREAGLPAMPRVDCGEVCNAAKADKKNGSGHIVTLGAIAAGKIYSREFSSAGFGSAYRTAVDDLIAKGVLRYE